MSALQNDWQGKRVLVAGMARSGTAAARLLASHGARVRATDQKPAAELTAEVSALAGQGVAGEFGVSVPGRLEELDAAVLSPGIPKTAPVVEALRAAGVPLYSELEVAAGFARAPIVAVTGTNGKSTTVTVLGALFAALERPVAVAGNVGWPLADAVETVPAEGVLVVEVSSFQLEDIHKFRPRAAALLNLTPDHLDRYASLPEYLAAKLRLFENQTAEDAAVFPAADPVLLPHAAGLPSRRLFFGPSASPGVAVESGRLLLRNTRGERDLIGVEELSLQGPHNHLNVAAALTLLAAVGEDAGDPRVLHALRTVAGLPHRLEPVGTVEGVPFFNDSKATNPESLEVALNSFAGGAVLIAGGRDKGGDFKRLAPLIAARARGVVLLGEAAPLLRAAWEETGVELVDAGRDLERAVAESLRLARAGRHPVLFSPGCASFDMFRDYVDRGDRFRALIQAEGEGS